MAKYYNDGNIKWSSIPRQWISPEDANALLERLGVSSSIKSENFYAPTAKSVYRNAVCYRGSGNIVDIYVVDREPNYDSHGRSLGFKLIPKRYFVRLNAPRTQTQTNGNAVRQYMEKRFYELYDITFKDAFGYSTIAENCIPKPLNETTRTGKISIEPMKGFYKIDASSAYGFEASKTLPTMNGAKIVEGFAEPDAEFPFAFYLEEHTLAIYGEFSNHPFPIARQTLLCPPCKYSLKPIFEELYAAKENATDVNEKQYYKDIMNFFVGMWHYRPKDLNGEPLKPGDKGYDPTCPRYAALAAVVKARCNDRMLDLREEIESVRGNEVWLINTDAVGWVGKDMPHLYTNEKKLGNLILEHRNAEVLVLGSKKYQIRDEKGIETKWAGVPIEKTQKMAFGEIIHSPERSEKIEFDPATSRFKITPIKGG